MATPPPSPHQELLDLIFSQKGLLGTYLQDFEERHGQKQMAELIAAVYEKNGIALIEAGTGIGKSLAYLVPAVIWALKHKEKTVISTHTISLQEQLVEKDIPFLLKVMDVDLKVSLVKGMGNYLCLRKWEEYAEEDGPEKQALEAWVETTKKGTQSEITFPLANATWEKINAEADLCNNVQCPHYKKCFFFKERRQASDAQLLVVNHHLLMSHLVARGQKDFDEQKSAIPPHERLILDEAHHLEETAIGALSNRVDFTSLSRQLNKLFSELNPGKSRLTQLRRMLGLFSASSLEEGFSTIVQKLEIELPAEKRNLHAKIENAFQMLEAYCRTLFATQEERELKWRLKPDQFKEKGWKEGVETPFLDVVAHMKSFAQMLFGLERNLEAIKNPLIKEKLPQHLLEIHAIAQRLEEKAEAIALFFSENASERVRWVEKTAFTTALVDARLDISSYLQEHLFDRLSTVSLCSATLTTNRTFDFMQQRLGISSENQEGRVAKMIFDSPFNYQKRTLLLVPTDLPLPSAPDFEAAAAPFIYKAICASQGNAFVLFTSYAMLKQCYAQVADLNEQGFHLLKQGDASRQLLIERFKNEEGSVLFGTDSFWEGVDVAGEALRCVILVKLPFKTPNDPIVEAQTEALERQGKDPFHDYSVPHAAVKFKQGFGRLMRKKNDRGCILCLDKRIITKGYGKIFLNSLPPSRTCFKTSGQLIEEMKTFYRETEL